MNQQAINLISNELLSRGVKPTVIIGVLAGIMGESGENLDPAAFNSKDPNGGAGGILQWNADRLVGDHGLLAFARQNGVNVDTNTPTDSKKVPLAIQVKFMGHELDGRYSGVLKGLQSINNSEEGLTTWVNNMEVPADKKGAIAQRMGIISKLGGKVSSTIVHVDTGTTGAPSGAQTPAEPPNPWSNVATALGQAFNEMSGGMGRVGSPQIADPPDQPAIRSMAAMTDFTPPPANPVPANLLGSQLASLAIQPTPEAMQDPASITQGAPSMTSMLGQIGTSYDPTTIDPRRTNSINPYMRPARLG